MGGCFVAQHVIFVDFRYILLFFPRIWLYRKMIINVSWMMANTTFHEKLTVIFKRIKTQLWYHSTSITQLYVTSVDMKMLQRGLSQAKMKPQKQSNFTIIQIILYFYILYFKQFKLVIQAKQTEQIQQFSCTEYNSIKLEALLICLVCFVV